MTRRHARSIRLGLLVLAVALAVVAVGPTNLVASDLTNDGSVAADSEPVVEVEETIEHDPHPDGNVSVELYVPADEVVDGAEISLYYPDVDVTGVQETNFDQTGDTSWAMTDVGESATLTYRVAVDNDDNTFHYARENWSSFELYEHTSDGLTADFEYNRTWASEGVYHPGNEWTIIGEVRAEEFQTANGATITLVEPGPLDAPPLSTIGDQLVAANERRSAGDVEQDVVGLAVPPIEDASGHGNDRRFVVEASSGVERYGHTWMHEYFHALDPFLGEFGETSNMTWYTEGYAEYGASIETLQQGSGDYANFVNVGNESQQYDAILADQTDSTHDANYQKGSLVLSAVDYQIRRATDGNRSYDDVVAQLESGYSVDLEQFLSTVATVGNQTIANRTASWVTTTESPELWSRSAHEDAFGPVVDIGEPTVNVSRQTGGHARSVDLSEDPQFYPNQTVVLEYELENAGSLVGDRELVTKLDSVDDLEQVDIESDTVSLAGGETATVTHTLQFDRTGDHIVTHELGTSSVTVQSVDPVDGNVSTDPDGDGLYEDLNGNGEMELADAVTLYQQRSDPAVTNNAPAYDFSGNGEIDLADVQQLYQEATG